MKSGTRVSVTSGNGKTDLGLGTYRGDVSLYAFRKWSDEEGPMLQSMRNAEDRPPDELVAEMIADGWTLDELDGNPKIELDSGPTVYGCQVWWKPANST